MSPRTYWQNRIVKIPYTYEGIVSWTYELKEVHFRNRRPWAYGDPACSSEDKRELPVILQRHLDALRRPILIVDENDKFMRKTEPALKPNKE